MDMIRFIQRLNVQFSDEEKEACLPVIDKMYELSCYARREGRFALERVAENEENVFLKRGLTLIVDSKYSGYITENLKYVEAIEEELQFLLLADNHKGAELLSRLIMMAGLSSIAAGENPRITKAELVTMLGDKYLLQLEAAGAEENMRRAKQ